MRRLATRVLLFAAIFVGADAAAGGLVFHILSGPGDPRQWFFLRSDLDSFGAALLGDSLFNSYYVDGPDQTLWATLEREAGIQAVPAALDGALGGDLLLGAEILSSRLTPGSLVFIDITPLRVWRRDEYHYEYEIFHYAGFVREPLSRAERDWNRFVGPIVARLLLWRDAPLVAKVATRRTHFARGDNRDRVWSDPPRFARARFEKWMASFRSGEARRDDDYTVISDIRAVLLRKRLRPVFVLGPLNRELLEAFANPTERVPVLGHLLRRHQSVTAYLRDGGFQFIDLFDAVPSDGFADMIHTNAAGDRLIGMAMASYAAATRRPDP